MSGENSILESVSTFDSSNDPSPQVCSSTHDPADPSKQSLDPFSHNAGPCSLFKVSLKTGSEIISYVGMSFGLLLVIIGASILAVEPKLEEEHIIDKSSYGNSLEYSSVISLVRGFYDIIFYAMLWVGTVWKSRILCLGWFVIKLVLTLFLLIGSIIVASLYGYVYFTLAPMIIFLPELYFLYVVLCFIKALHIEEIRLKKEKKEDIDTAEFVMTGIYGPGTLSGEQQSQQIQPSQQKQQQVFPDYMKRAREIQAKMKAGSLESPV